MSSFFASLEANTDYPHSKDFDDRYYLEGLGLYESQCVYLDHQQIFEKNIDHRGPFVVGEIGFGSALNFLAFFQLWATSRRPQGPLIYISYEQFPMHPSDLAKSLEPWRGQLGVAIDQLIEHYKSPTPGLNVFFFSQEQIILILLVGEASEQLRLCHFKANHWMLDGFAPAKNPSAWSLSLLENVTRLSAPSATLGTFTAASMVRRGLESCGWQIFKVKGFGRKRHRLEGVLTGQKKSFFDNTPITIFGSGIAGVSLAFFHDWLKIPARIVSCPDPAASAVPYIYSLFKPRNNWDFHQIFNIQTHQFSGAFFKQLSFEADISYGPAPILSPQDLSPPMRERFYKAIGDRCFSELLQLNEEGFIFPRGFTLNGKKAITALTHACGLQIAETTFEKAHDLLCSEIQHGHKIGIASTFTTQRLLKKFPECSMIRGQTWLTDSGWLPPTHERYRFGVIPDMIDQAHEAFLGFRSSHSSYLPLFGPLCDGHGVYSTYHGSKGFSSAPWCGLVLALQNAGLFSYEPLLLMNPAYSIRSPAE